MAKPGENLTISIPRELVDVMKAAASREYTSVSGLIRAAVVRDLREKGLLDEAKA